VAGRDPDWNLGEFAILVASPNVGSDTLAGSDLNSRSTGAIEAVRQGLCLYLDDKEVHGILSEMMLSFLAARRGHLICGVCGKRA
jgi:hypothetical protein